MLLAVDLIDHISDHAWPGGRIDVFGLEVTVMSSAIATMLLVLLALPLLLIPPARRAAGALATPTRALPTGGYNFVEALVVFVRDLIARPALHDRAYAYLPFLLTLFVFVLSMNLFGILPVESISRGLGLPHTGAPATSVATVCGGLAAIALAAIVIQGFRKAIRGAREKRGWPLPLALAASPVLWFLGLAPHVPGVVGKMLVVPLALIELIGLGAKCFSLMVRLAANMMSGHTLLAVTMMFILQTLDGFLTESLPHVFYVAPICILGSVVISLLELLVAGLQAYIFTFLTAMFLGLYVEMEH